MQRAWDSRQASQTSGHQFWEGETLTLLVVSMIEGKIGSVGDHQDTRQVELPGILRTETKDGKRQVLGIIRARFG